MTGNPTGNLSKIEPSAIKPEGERWLKLLGYGHVHTTTNTERSENYWPVAHTRGIHSKFEFAHTSEIERIFGNFRTFIRKMYHHTTLEKFPDYVREFCSRIFHAGVI